MRNKLFLGLALSGLMTLGVTAQEKKKVKVVDTVPVKTETVKVKETKAVKSDATLAHPEANVNFEENVSNTTLGQDQISRKSLNYDGMVVGENRPSVPIKLDEPRKLRIQFKADNPNALYYLVDRLDNIVIPATEGEFNDLLPAGEYFLRVGLTPEAVKNQEKSAYTFIVD